MSSLNTKSAPDGSGQNDAGAPAASGSRQGTGDAGSEGFVRFLVHELRNMLAPIRNAAHIVRLRGAADANLRPVADIMERQINGIGQLLNSLAEADRIRRGEVTLDLAPVDLVDILKKALTAIQPQVEKRGQSLHVSWPDAPVGLRADAARLTQVFGSLLENAAKYAPEGGEIRLDVVSKNGGVEVKVRDNGIGMNADLMRRAFDFYAASGKPEQAGKGGLGVGLAVARRLVELHGGRITAASAGNGQGSELAVFLPLDDGTQGTAPTGALSSPESSVRVEQASTNTGVPSTQAASAAHRILIADDNAAVRVSLSALFQDLGHVVKAAADGEAALEAAQEWLPEFVFLDVNMPKLSGVEVARRLRRRFPATVMRLIMLSGADLDEPTLRSAKRAGFDHCVDKIGDPRVLTELLRAGPPPSDTVTT